MALPTITDPTNKKELVLSYPAELEEFVLDSFWYLYGDKSNESPTTEEKETATRGAIKRLLLSQIRAANMRKAEDQREAMEQELDAMQEAVEPYVGLDDAPV